MIVDRASAALAITQAVQGSGWTPGLAKGTRREGSVCDCAPAHSTEGGKPNCVVVAAVVTILVVDRGFVCPGVSRTRGSSVVRRAIPVCGPVSRFLHSGLCAWTPRGCCGRKVGRKGRQVAGASRDLAKGGNGRVLVEGAVVSVAAQLGKAVIEVSRRLAMARVVSRFWDGWWRQARTAARDALAVCIQLGHELGGVQSGRC
jgi:hypothetical protein